MNRTQRECVVRYRQWVSSHPAKLTPYISLSSFYYYYRYSYGTAQVVTVALKPGEHCQGEPGSMMYLSPQVDMLASYAGCWNRCCGGESCFILNFTNHNSSGHGYAALVPSDPLAKVVPVDLSAPEVGGCLIVQQGTVYHNVSDVFVVVWP
jgi:uncharacterized protein (AIM24 family)